MRDNMKYKKLIESVRRANATRRPTTRNRQINEANWNGMDNEQQELFNIINDEYYDGDFDLLDFISSIKNSVTKRPGFADRTDWDRLIKKLVAHGLGGRPLPPNFITANDIDNAICNGNIDFSVAISDIIKTMPINTIKRTMRELGISFSIQAVSEARRPTRSRHVNEDKEFNDIMRDAKQGKADAQTLIGIMYHNGDGVARNYGQAVKWLRLAAKQGDANGQFNLGVMYSTGKGVQQNKRRAEKWYGLAAEQDNKSINESHNRRHDNNVKRK